jgi:hypothetical protein
MGKHETGYARVARDFYSTPSWVTNALVELVNVRNKRTWECASGAGDMSEPLGAAGARVFSSDIIDRGYPAFDLLYDFTSPPDPAMQSWDGIITNPPFGPRGKLAEAFIESGLRRIGEGFLALLLPADFDSAKTRMHLFGGCARFAGKLVLTRRVKWFEHPTNPCMQPKENSAWYLWGNVEFRRLGAPAPVIHYAPRMAA